MSTRKVFIIGGARSGKSTFAVNDISKIEGQKAYIATSEALDDEMKARIQRHKNERGNDWNTIEEPLSLTKVLYETSVEYETVLVDCLTLWVTNLLLRKNPAASIEESMEEFVNAMSDRELNCSNLYIVSNEVGMGIVPENKLAREFRDYTGMLNQKVAAACDEVYQVVAGIPVKIK